MNFAHKNTVSSRFCQLRMFVYLSIDLSIRGIYIAPFRITVSECSLHIFGAVLQGHNEFGDVIHNTYTLDTYRMPLVCSAVVFDPSPA